MTSKLQKIALGDVEQGTRFRSPEGIVYIRGPQKSETYCSFQAHGHNEVSRYSNREVFECWNVEGSYAVTFPFADYCDEIVEIIP